MKNIYEIVDGRLVDSDSVIAPVIVYTMPDDEEKKQLFETLGHDMHDLESALDPDEVSRVEFGSDDTYIIWKRPNDVTFQQQLKFEVSSVGLFIQKDRLTVILGDFCPAFSGKEFQKIQSVNDLLMKFFLHTAHHFLDHLKVIKQQASEIQTKLNLSMENNYLIQTFVLSENLAYYLNAIEANAGVLSKLHGCALKLNFTPQELATLDDVLIENHQCERQTHLYSSMMSGLMDARGAIINNNMNVLLKNLTLINVVFLPLNLIAGIFGMSEYSMLTKNIPAWISYSGFFFGVILSGWLFWMLLVQINRPEAGVRAKKR